MMSLMKFWSALTFRKVVALRHFDGEVSYHIARHTPYGMTCNALGRKCLLLKGGGFKGPSWVDAWEIV